MEPLSVGCMAVAASFQARYSNLNMVSRMTAGLYTAPNTSRETKTIHAAFTNIFHRLETFVYQDTNQTSESENASVDYLRRGWIVGERKVLVSKDIENKTFTSHSLRLEPGGQVQLLWTMIWWTLWILRPEPNKPPLEGTAVNWYLKD